MAKSSFPKVIIFNAIKPGFETLAYHDQWTKAWLENPCLNATEINISASLSFAKVAKIFQADLLVFLHSTNSNEFAFPKKIKRLLPLTRAKKILFLGNEYKLIPEKISLVDELRIDVLCSQLPKKSADWLYSRCEHAKTISIPHALDPDRYYPKVSISDRAIDIGVRAYEYPWYLGDRDRAEIIETFLNHSTILRKYKTDLSMDPSSRFTGEEWSNFLNRCKTTISTEAGARFLQRDDSLRNKVNQYLEKHPTTPFREIDDRFFSVGVPGSVSGKCISSRHFEAIGTRTAQIMFPGEFNDILKPEIHYIKLNRDYSNLSDVLEKIEDVSYLEKMTRETLDYCLSEHQYRNRIDKVLNSIS